MREKSITDLIEKLKDAVDKADIANEAACYQSESFYILEAEIKKAKYICDEILQESDEKQISKDGIKICEINNAPCNGCKPACNDWIYKKSIEECKKMNLNIFETKLNKDEFTKNDVRNLLNCAFKMQSIILDIKDKYESSFSEEGLNELKSRDKAIYDLVEEFCEIRDHKKEINAEAPSQKQLEISDLKLKDLDKIPRDKISLCHYLTAIINEISGIKEDITRLEDIKAYKEFFPLYH